MAGRLKANNIASTLRQEAFAKTQAEKRQQAGLEGDGKQRAVRLGDELAERSSVSLPAEELQRRVPMSPTGDEFAVQPEAELAELAGQQVALPESDQPAREGLAVPGEERTIGAVAERPRQRTVEGFDTMSPEQAALALDPSDPTTFSLTEETANRLRQEQLAKLSKTGQYLGTMTEDEAIEAGQQELQQGYFQKTGAFLDEEGAKNFGNYIDNKLMQTHYRDISITDGADIISVEKDLENAGKSFRFDGGKANIFAVQIPNSFMDPNEIGNVARAQDIIRQNADTFQYIVKSTDKLGMAENDADPNSEIKSAFGATAYLAVLMELGNRLNLQSTEIDKVASERFHDNAMDRTVFGRAVADRIEQMLFHSGDIDASSFTGEIKGPGYKSRLTSDEKDVLGQVILQGFADSPMFNWINTVAINDPSGDGKPKYTYVVSDAGAIQVPRLRRALLKELGLKGHERPVSLVPTAEGIMISESGYTQNEITRQVVPNRLTKKVKEGISALSKVAHTVSPHKVTLYAGIMASATMNNTGLFAKYTKQDPRYLEDKRNELFERFMFDYDNGVLNVERFFQPGYRPNRQEVEEALRNEAFRQAKRIQQIHYNLRAETLADGANRIGTSFYYGYTAINNSSRMMISNTELNYQADKVARFLVDGAQPVRFKKGSNNKFEKGFFGVLARSLVDKADKKLPADQIAMFNAERKKFDLMAADVLNYMDRVGGVAKQMDLPNDPATALQGAIQQGMVPSLEQSLSSETLAHLEKMGKDGFYFALDALHELGRYNRIDPTNPNQEFITRVKAEVDGNSNGAVIQAMQMGLINILSRGGVIYQSADDLEQDIRDEVFDSIEQNVLSGYGQKEQQVIADIRAAGKRKELLKIPIMTSIYGKDPNLHEDTAEEFYIANRNLFGNFERDEAVKFLQEQIAFGLKHRLGGAFEHGKIMSRVGYAFNFANQINQTEGANGYLIQSGGWERVETGAEVIQFAEDFKNQPGVQRAGERLRQSTMTVGLARNVPSAQARADARRLRDNSRSNPGTGSKLRNQMAVNATQNIDATIAQATVAEVGRRRNGQLMMQVYDAFMGDAATFADLRDTANRQFKIVNKQYNMVRKEVEAFNDLIKSVKKEVERKTKNGTGFDIGTQGEYRMIGEFITKPKTAIENSFTIIGDERFGTTAEGSAQFEMDKKKKNAYDKVATIAQYDTSFNLRFPPQHHIVSPKVFLKMFLDSIEALQIRQDLEKFEKKVRNNKAVAEEMMNEFINQFS
jgi:hypothetical protein